ncbi:MAG TPA: tRNA lysidine(34) synthetase TilS, partial [bacterium]|nr:tRNA lysidine(34) synthetase TilS [bacterium]
KLQIVHLNHGLRATEADRDQRYVEKLAELWRLPVICERVNTPAFCEENGISEEEGARILRYNFYEEVLQRTGADAVALGHHADDQVETIVDHFIRGSGLKGLSGMELRRGKFIRPLLFATREEIETYVRDFSLDYQIDSTNLSLKYRRNQIRSQFIPYVKHNFNPGFSKVVLRTGRIMSEADQYLRHQAAAAFEQCLIISKKDKITLEINSFLSYFTVIQKYVIYHVLEKIGVHSTELNTATLDRILELIRRKKPGKKIRFKSGRQVLIDRDAVVFFCRQPAEFMFDVEPGGTYYLPGSSNQLTIDKLKTSDVSSLFTEDSKVEYVDFDQVQGQLKLRNWRPGERFYPLNMKGKKKVADFLTDLKVPLHERTEIPVLICERGIVWVVGYRIDDRFKIEKHTENVLRLKLIEGTVE